MASLVSGPLGGNSPKVETSWDYHSEQPYGPFSCEGLRVVRLPIWQWALPQQGLPQNWVEAAGLLVTWSRKSPIDMSRRQTQMREEEIKPDLGSREE